MVEGVALELLCRLLFTEGSNPSLSVPSSNSLILLTKRIKYHYIKRKLYSNTTVDKELKTPSRSMIPKWEKNTDQTLIYLNLRVIYFDERDQNCPNPCDFLFYFR